MPKGLKSVAPGVFCAALVMVMARPTRWKMFRGQKASALRMSFIDFNVSRQNPAG